MTYKEIATVILVVSLLLIFVWYVYQLEKSHREIQEYLDKNYHRFGDFYIRNNE